MKILAVCGSPRKGNTETMLRKILEGAAYKGAAIDIVLLRDKDIRPCLGDVECENSGKCSTRDDMKDILRKMVNADVVVLGSPTYFDTVSGLFKNFMDRTLPLYSEKKMKDKPVVIVAVGGEELGKSSIEDAAKCIKKFCEIHGMKVVKTILGSASKPGEISKNIKKMQECFDVGEGLVK